MPLRAWCTRQACLRSLLVTCYLCTPTGTIEARDRSGAFFGEQRLRDLLLSVSGEGVSGICGKVLGELDRFTESALDDDIALVSLEFLRGRS